jgi:hypothetical protein
MSAMFGRHPEPVGPIRPRAVPSTEQHLEVCRLQLREERSSHTLYEVRNKGPFTLSRVCLSLSREFESRVAVTMFSAGLKSKLNTFNPSLELS